MKIHIFNVINKLKVFINSDIIKKIKSSFINFHFYLNFSNINIKLLMVLN